MTYNPTPEAVALATDISQLMDGASNQTVAEALVLLMAHLIEEQNEPVNIREKMIENLDLVLAAMKETLQ